MPPHNSVGFRLKYGRILPQEKVGLPPQNTARFCPRRQKHSTSEYGRIPSQNRVGFRPQKTVGFRPRRR
ncbi:hypothetical protein Hamer_G017680 [Homarus americanus]|uniref:Uncharacterized protein n=1 Tax=Homarus americanus TaxID=6706 RepID=A0A8J5MJK6_HOMAM|nr:hypothetical protein Hamer_G017680 [Homarus americanus]